MPVPLQPGPVTLWYRHQTKWPFRVFNHVDQSGLAGDRPTPINDFQRSAWANVRWLRYEGELVPLLDPPRLMVVI
jgi:hypothetical protein